MILIDPIKNIVNKLNNHEFRDCDIKWLDTKLENFVELAANTLNIPGLMSQRESVKPAYMNDYAISYYSKYFSGLLDYFKTL